MFVGNVTLQITGSASLVLAILAWILDVSDVILKRGPVVEPPHIIPRTVKPGTIEVGQILVWMIPTFLKSSQPADL